MKSSQRGTFVPSPVPTLSRSLTFSLVLSLSHSLHLHSWVKLNSPFLSDSLPPFSTVSLYPAPSRVHPYHLPVPRLGFGSMYSAPDVGPSSGMRCVCCPLFLESYVAAPQAIVHQLREVKRYRGLHFPLTLGGPTTRSPKRRTEYRKERAQKDQA